MKIEKVKGYLSYSLRKHGKYMLFFLVALGLIMTYFIVNNGYNTIHYDDSLFVDATLIMIGLATIFAVFVGVVSNEIEVIRVGVIISSGYKYFRKSIILSWVLILSFYLIVLLEGTGILKLKSSNLTTFSYFALILPTIIFYIVYIIVSFRNYFVISHSEGYDNIYKKCLFVCPEEFSKKFFYSCIQNLRFANDNDETKFLIKRVVKNNFNVISAFLTKDYSICDNDELYVPGTVEEIEHFFAVINELVHEFEVDNEIMMDVKNFIDEIGKTNFYRFLDEVIFRLFSQNDSFDKKVIEFYDNPSNRRMLFNTLILITRNTYVQKIIPGIKKIFLTIWIV